jgi:hypothetical protein
VSISGTLENMASTANSKKYYYPFKFMEGFIFLQQKENVKAQRSQNYYP